MGASAAQSPPHALPLQNLGLEHLDIVVPDPAASARFYARIFKTTLHQQPLRDTIRYFVLLGDLPADRQVGYIAIGAAAPGRAPSIGHYCTLAKVYDRAGMAKQLEAAGFPGIRGTGGLGMWPDPDGIELQLFQPPAGLVTAAVPSTLDLQNDGLVTPIGVDHVMLLVNDVEKSLPYYRFVYGAGVEGRPSTALRAGREGGRVWLNLEKSTRIGIEKAPDGMARIGHYAIKVAPFDRRAVTARLQELGAKVQPSPDEKDVLRFTDNNGIVVELSER
ncbi:MAG TPA: VOC family protein [Vicinamibacterales bacterium]|nr:VOC family protein [Vicinamibacterales bacterium]